MKHAGALGGENVGMSNHKSGESPDRRKPKVSSAMSIIGGLGVPKDNCAFGHGRPMDSRLIFRPLCNADGETEKISQSELLDLRRWFPAVPFGKSGGSLQCDTVELTRSPQG